MSTTPPNRVRNSKRTRLLTPPTQIEIHLCVPDDQQKWLPKRRRAPMHLPLEAPLPRIGEVIYLSSSSAWGVAMVIHEWRSAQDLRIELWLEHVHAARQQRPSGFSITQ